MKKFAFAVALTATFLTGSGYCAVVITGGPGPAVVLTGAIGG